MKNPPGGPKPPLCPVPERLFGVSPAHWRKANCFSPVRNSAVLDQLAELIQTRRRLHDVEASCNLRGKRSVTKAVSFKIRFDPVIFPAFPQPMAYRKEMAARSDLCRRIFFYSFLLPASQEWCLPQELRRRLSNPPNQPTAQDASLFTKTPRSASSASFMKSPMAIICQTLLGMITLRRLETRFWTNQSRARS